MPLRVLVKTAITVVTPPVDFNSFPPTRRYPSHPSTVVEPPRDHRRVASLLFRDCTAVLPPSHRRRGATTGVGPNRHHRSDTASSF